jgi:hypothetical protein
MDPKDRKDAIRRYKETPRPAGIYRVRNLKTGASLVGSSVDVPSMLTRMRFGLETGGHRDRALQADWDAMGPDAFAFETVDLLEMPEEPGYDPKDDLEVLLVMWREKLGLPERGGYA